MELIDREKLKKELNDYYKPDYTQPYGGMSADAIAAMSAIDAAPTVDAEPVVHGYWATEGVTPKGYAVCSVCRDVFVDTDWVADGKWMSCPGCRAKMDGRAEK